MKKLYTLAICFLTLTLAGQVEELKYDISLGEQNAFMMDHPDADKKMVEKVMEDKLKEFGKVKRNRKADEWICEECNVHLVSHTPFRVYYKIVERKNLVTTYMFFDDGSKFISSANAATEAEKIKDLNMDIYYEVKREIIRKELETMEDKLEDYEKDLSKLVKNKKDLHEDIEKYKEKIRQAEKDIEKNLNDQQDKKIEIELQKKAINTVIDKLNSVGRNS